MRSHFARRNKRTRQYLHCTTRYSLVIRTVSDYATFFLFQLYILAIILTHRMSSYLLVKFLNRHTAGIQVHDRTWRPPQKLQIRVISRTHLDAKKTTYTSLAVENRSQKNYTRRRPIRRTEIYYHSPSSLVRRTIS